MRKNQQILIQMKVSMLDIEKQIIESSSAEQLEFIKSPVENSKLLGIPGGGKTTTIIKKLVYHIKVTKDLSKSEFIVLTFSKRARRDFIYRGQHYMSQTKSDKYFTESNIVTVHSLAGSINSKLGTKKVSSLEIAVVTASNIVERENTESLKTVKKLKNTKLIVVDEAQDLSYNQYTLIKTIVDKLGAKMVMVGDPNQNIYQFQGGSDKYLMDFDAKLYTLTVNHRSSPEIVQFINYFRPWKNDLKKMISSREKTGILPHIYVQSKKEILESIVTDVLKSSNKHEIAIIGPVKKAGAFNVGLQDLVNLFNSKKIKYVRHYDENKTSETIEKTDNHLVDDHVNLYTVHGSKGLEFKKVFVINFHCNTYGLKPSEQKFKEFFYLWYVGLSRAKDVLKIYADKAKDIWPEIYDVPANLYKIEGLEVVPDEKPDTDFRSERDQAFYSVTSLIEKMTEEQLYELNECIDFEISTKKIFNDIEDENCDNIFLKREPLYGMFFQTLFEFYYSKSLNKPFSFVIKMKSMLENNVTIDYKYRETASKILYRSGNNYMITKAQLNSVKDKFSKQEKAVYYIIMKAARHIKWYSPFAILYANDNIFSGLGDIIEICDKITNDDGLINIYNIFLLNLFAYQQEIEGKYLWDLRHTFLQKLYHLHEFISRTRKWAEVASKAFPKMIFEERIKSNYLEFVGIPDIISDSNIFDIKFVTNLNLRHYLQLFLYNFCANPYITTHKRRLELWNLRLGEIHVVKYKLLKSPIEILFKISEFSNQKVKRLDVLYDLETTGLDIRRDEIIERCFYEINFRKVLDSGFVKPTWKILDKYYPSGITKKDLAKADTKQTFLEKLTKVFERVNTICLIAHNGNSFDSRIMENYGLSRLANRIILIDSISLINHHLNEKMASKSLGDLYTQVLGKEKLVSHRAIDDVMMLVEIFNKLKIDVGSYYRI